MYGRAIWRTTKGKMVLRRPGSGTRAAVQSRTIGLLKLRVESANAPGDEKTGQKKTSLITAAQVCYYQLGKVFAHKVGALITSDSARFHHK